MKSSNEALMQQNSNSTSRLAIVVETFSLDGEAWQVRLNGKVLSANYNSKGAAEAGAQVEARRADRRAEKFGVSNHSPTKE